MQIIAKDTDPPTFEFNEVDEPERLRVMAFIAEQGGTIVNPWEPFLVAFEDAHVLQAFTATFGAHIAAS
jgi:hypothetical protein